MCVDSMQDVKWSITIQSAAVNWVTQAIHSFDVLKKSNVIHQLKLFQLLVVCQHHAVPIPNAVKLAVPLFAHAYLIIWDEHQIVGQNVLPIQNVLVIWLASMNVVLIHALDHALQLLLAIVIIIKPFADVQMDTPVIHLLHALPFQVN